MNFEKRLKQTLTKDVNRDVLERLKKLVIIHSFEEVGEKVSVTFTKYNMSKYEEIVEGLIEDRYSVKEEICLTNKGIKNPTDYEYVEYRAFVEICKEKAREFISERNAAFLNK